MFEMCLDVQEFLAIYNELIVQPQKNKHYLSYFKMTKRSGAWFWLLVVISCCYYWKEIHFYYG